MGQDGSLAQLDIRTVVLVGRQDFGRCPLAARSPTALWPLGDRSVLARLLDHTARDGITRAVVCCSEDACAAVEAACAGAALEVQVLTEDLTKGTAGCLRDAVASDPGDLLIVMSGSMMCPPSIPLLVETHRASEADLTVVFNPAASGDAAHESPAEIYLCDPTVLQHIPIGGYSDIKEGLIPSILRAGGTVRPLVLPEQAGNFHDRAGYLDAVALYLRQEQRAEDGFVLRDSSDGRVAPPAAVSVHPTARIYGPVAMGAEAQVLEDALVVGPAVVGPRALVGPGSAVVGSVLWPGAHVGARCEIRQCIVAEERAVPDGAEVVEQALCDSRHTSGASAWTRLAAAAAARIDRVAPRWAGYVAGAVVFALVFLWSYWSTLAGLWRVWSASDEYSAGLLVPPLAAYVLWTRRRDLARVPIRPAIVAGTVVFLLAQAMRSFGLHHMYASAERLSLVVTVAALVLLLGGWRLSWKLAGVLLFLCLMLPWPNRIQAMIGLPLQSRATDSAVFCLELVGYGVQQDGNVITIGTTQVFVAEACNGLRMITAFFVICGLVALLARRAWWEKLLVLVSSLPIALLCNTLRLAATAAAFTVLEAARWEKLFHDFGGYAMMPLAVAMTVGELWLVARLTTRPVETTPEIIARQRPRRVPGS